MPSLSATTATELTLGDAYRGRALRPGDAGYDEARGLFNGMWDRKPALIAKCHGVADVVDAVRLAAERNLPLSVYGGGHGVTGHAVADGGVVVDLREMKAVQVDPVARVARVQGGATWGDVDRETQLHGLAVTGGRMSGTGVGGLTLGGGSGWLERSLGYTVDNLVAAEVVLADGRVVRASERDHADLFWGLRGGGGNFGVVTSFEFRLHQVGPIVLGGMLLFPGFQGREVLQAYRDLMADAPDELGGGVAFITAPPADFVPEPARGKLACGVMVVWSGDPAAGQAVISPLRDLGPAVDMVQPIPYTVAQTLIDAGNPHGLRNYWKGEFLTGLDAPAIEALVAAAERKPSPNTQLLVVPGGGAVARVPEKATAAGQRSAPWNIHVLSMWEDPDEDAANMAWTRETAGALAPFKTGRVFLNFNSEGEDLDVREAVGDDTFGRLRRLKGVYDPKSMFQANYGIPPAA